MKNKREIIIAGIFLLVGIVVAHLFINTNKSISPIKSEIPECYAGRCPQYFSMDVDDDNSSSESVVIIPTAMTQGAGKLEIIRKGEIIFESPELMQIGVREADGGNGFVLTYSKNINSTDNPNEIRYRYKNGKFVQDDRPPSLNTLDSAIELIKKEGYSAIINGPMYDFSGLNALIGMCTGSADGHCYKTFFFYNGKYIGTDNSDPSIGIEEVWKDDKTIALYYRLYRKNDSLCCSTAGAALVRFQWDGTKLKALDPIPTSDWFADLHR